MVLVDPDEEENNNSTHLAQGNMMLKASWKAETMEDARWDKDSREDLNQLI